MIGSGLLSAFFVHRNGKIGGNVRRLCDSCPQKFCFSSRMDNSAQNRYLCRSDESQTDGFRRGRPGNSIGRAGILRRKIRCRGQQTDRAGPIVKSVTANRLNP